MLVWVQQFQSSFHILKSDSSNFVISPTINTLFFEISYNKYEDIEQNTKKDMEILFTIAKLVKQTTKYITPWKK